MFCCRVILLTEILLTQQPLEFRSKSKLNKPFPMKQFFKMFFAAFLAGVSMLFIGFLLVVGIVASFSAKSETKFEDNSVMRLNLNMIINERSIDNPFANIDPFGSNQTSGGLYEIIEAIEAAKNDDRIKGIYLQSGISMAGMATLKEIRDALIDFKSSGKFIISYSEIYSQKGLYISSVADSIFVAPEGGLEWTGLSSTVPFYVKMLAKIGVKPQVIRASNNRFKSAVEPFLEESISESNREQLSLLLNDIWNEMTSAIAASRNISADSLKLWANDLRITTAATAAELGLVTRTAYQDEVDALLRDLLDIKEDDSIPFASVSTVRASKDKKGKFLGDRIAIVFAQGDINSGTGDDLSIGSERIAQALRKARRDEKVKAVVFRINSPGGSTLASDVIMREVQLLREAGKPVVASYGNLAASGGYYISCIADKIVAQPTTITGSIGVFGLFFTAEELLNDKVGIRYDRVKTSKHADMGSIDRDLTEAERKYFQNMVDYFYGRFLGLVATGRNLDSLFVDEVGQGRVWTGVQALELGLVDTLGSLQTAVEIARDLAGLGEDYRITTLPEKVDPFQELLKSFGMDEEARMKKRLGILYPYYEKFQTLEKVKGYQSHIGMDIIIE
ncbi:MAG: signal peptide peptidase SppA [Flavobacteriales bacterium]|nr:MAG: signal peptide peptidase SppA [Flavobacteriales bacterium]